jgi:glycosyltransferase involved in cell wall biosynthesis
VNGHVLFCGAWDEGPGYPRTCSLRAGLYAAGVGVREVRAEGLGCGKQALVRAPWRWPAAWWRQQRTRSSLLARLSAELASARPRCIVVPYPGHALVGPIARAANVPVVLDLFLSAYDTSVEDRALAHPGSLAAHWLRALDARACAAADLVLLDTPCHAAYVAALTGLPAERFAWLPVHDPDADAPAPWRAHDGALRLLFFGTGVPLHGLATLVDAVAAAPAVHLTLVGGDRDSRARALARLGERLALEPEFVARERLSELLAASELVAGVFGTSGKAQRVVPFKVVHALAAGRPVVTADTPAVGSWLDGSGAAFLVPAGDPVALAERLGALAADRGALAAAAACARPAYDRHFGTERLAQRWRELLARLPAVRVRSGAA